MADSDGDGVATSLPREGVVMVPLVHPRGLCLVEAADALRASEIDRVAWPYHRRVCVHADVIRCFLSTQVHVEVNGLRVVDCDCGSDDGEDFFRSVSTLLDDTMYDEATTAPFLSGLGIAPPVNVGVGIKAVFWVDMYLPSNVIQDIRNGVRFYDDDSDDDSDASESG